MKQDRKKRLYELRDAHYRQLDSDAPESVDGDADGPAVGRSSATAGGHECRLDVLRDGERIEEVALKQGKHLIGRHSVNDIRLRDRSVSRCHALIVRDDSGCLVIDLGSTNGTLVNGKTIDTHTLGDRDEIKIGRLVLIFHRDQGTEPAKAPSSRDFRDTVVLDKDESPSSRGGAG